MIQNVDPERAHRRALALLGGAQSNLATRALLRRAAPAPDPRLQVDLWGLHFSNPLGVAAGLDKDAQAVCGLLALGFGHIEVGTVTPQPQAGNTKPRVWRIPESEAIINALGFPSQGMQRVAQRLKRERRRPRRLRSGRDGRGLIGINLGKNKDTDLSAATDDYLRGLDNLLRHADYIALNISSPNTPGLRHLQRAETVSKLVGQVVKSARQRSAEAARHPPPVLVKLSPDESEGALRDAAEAAVNAGAAGIIATNTTVERSALQPQYAKTPGGLSGRPLRQQALAVTRLLYRHFSGKVPIVGVGGISSVDDLIERMRHGASLVQAYTGFVYGGPRWPGQLLQKLSTAAEQQRWPTITDIIGSAV